MTKGERSAAWPDGWYDCLLAGAGDGLEARRTAGQRGPADDGLVGIGVDHGDLGCAFGEGRGQHQGRGALADTAFRAGEDDDGHGASAWIKGKLTVYW